MEPILLPDARAGNLTEIENRALDDVFCLIYGDLRRLASFLRQGGPDRSIDTTALVHEAWLKLKHNQKLARVSEPHLRALAAKAMRQILVDQARARSALKRDSEAGTVFVDIADSHGIASSDSELIALDAALDELKILSPRQATIVESRFFGGFSVAETAAALGVSESVVERDWRAAKAWLKSRIRRRIKVVSDGQRTMAASSGAVSPGRSAPED